MCSEASFLSSGFGIYAKEILSRLHNTGKYEIAEFASYGVVNDPRDKTIPWKYYANAVKENDPRHKEYTSRGDNQFGRWRFEKVLLDFRPDVVIDVRDYWMSHYEGISPLRKFYHWILMPTVDSEPQQEEWMDTYLSADAIFTYSDWGAEVLKKQSSDKVNYIATASPGVDLQTFKILPNKIEIKKTLGLPLDSLIIGSVMRNQKRKLIPELMISFRKFLDILEQSGNPLGEKTYLYLHTSYPDMGWDIPELLKDNRLSNRVLFTYACRKCSFTESTVYLGPNRTCPRCLNKSMTMPSVTNGITSEKLCEIYNTFDLYVQYAICEGFGMPQVEAGACGIPIATVEYSAMVDIIKKLDAMSIKPKTHFKELETKAIRVYPDNDQLVDCMIEIASLSESKKNERRLNTRKLTEKYYNWDDIASVWERYLDQVDLHYRSNWDSPPQYIADSLPDPSQVNNTIFFHTMKTITENIATHHNKLSSMQMLYMLQNCDYGFSGAGAGLQNYNYNNVLEHFKIEIDNINQSENVRYNKTKFNDDFIQYAHIKSNT